MRALMIAPAMPALTGGGLSMRAGFFLYSLSRIAETDVLVVPYGGVGLDEEVLDKSFNANCRVIAFSQIDQSAIPFGRRVREFVMRQLQFPRRNEFGLADILTSRALTEIAQTTAGVSYDLVHVGRTYMADAGFAVSGDPCRTIDADENDAEVYRQWAAVSRAAGDMREEKRLMRQVKACENLQHSKLSKFDLIFASSQLECLSLEPYCPDRPVAPIQNSVRRPIAIERQDDGHTLIFVGSLAHQPNADGVKWFVKEVWPQLVANAKKRPSLLIIGRRCPPDIQDLALVDGISVYNDAPRVDEFYARATLAIVPLFIGGGTRLKIIEAALMGVPVVSTPLGAEGLPFENGTEIILTKDAKSMAAAILSAFADPQGTTRMGARAKLRAMSDLDFETVSTKLTETWLNLLAEKRAQKS
ncbi:MAG: glycosyltransferase family 4 protein [Aestuariivirga sp.]